jgi:ornithine cyclodeaminase/alanine dehydrogenase-like protein (mu-crystallin family)
METIILTVDDIRVMVQQVGLNGLMDEMIRRLEDAFACYDPQQTTIPARDGFSYTKPEVGLVEWMPVMGADRQVTIKIVGYHPGNPSARGLPTILSTVSAYDTSTGHLFGLADGVFLTALRTGAASAVAARALAAESSRVIGMIGCGAQAVTQLHALSRQFDIQRVWAYDIDPWVAKNFIERTSFLNLDVIPVNEQQGLKQLVQEADILTTCTSVNINEGPVFEDWGLKPWVHINAVGSDFPGKYEVPLSVLKRALVVPDFLEQAIREGESQQLTPAEIGPTITEVVQNPGKYRTARERMTVFDSTGWALEDEAALKLLLDYAADLKLGTRVSVEAVLGDPRNPYEFTQEPALTGVRTGKI